MKCNNCGANLPNNSQFCSVCGAKVDSETRWDEKEEKSFLKFIKKIIFLPITVLNLISKKSSFYSKKKKIFITALFWFFIFSCASYSNQSAPKAKEVSVSEQAKQEKEDIPTKEKSDSKEDNASPEDVETQTDPTASMDLATKNAYASAKSYLALSGFSKQGLIDQLSSEYGSGYTLEQATAAVEALEINGEVDWNEEALRSAKSYLNLTAFSRQGLIEQLTSPYGSQFTQEQAEYAVNQLGL